MSALGARVVPNTAAAVDAEVTALLPLDLEGLRSVWRERYGPPPPLRSPDLLRRMLAWRIQSEALGGLPLKTIKALRSRTALPDDRGPRLDPGTRLVREFKGQRHEAVILEDGVRYAGQRYGSLSEVARTITGVRWNGPRFFGLRGAA